MLFRSVGFTGNFVGAVWYGNDSFRPTNRVTGGSLPALTWQRFMEAAHQNIELKPIPYIEDPFPEGQRDVAEPSDNPLMTSGQTGLTVEAEGVLSSIAERFDTLAPLQDERVASAAPAGPLPVASNEAALRTTEN